jgi:hypothetical protein
MWMLLMPAEVEIVMRPVSGTGQNAEVMREVQAAVDPLSGDLTLSKDALARVRGASRNWRGGYEGGLRAVLDAAERHR